MCAVLNAILAATARVLAYQECVRHEPISFSYQLIRSVPAQFRNIWFANLSANSGHRPSISNELLLTALRLRC